MAKKKAVKSDEPKAPKAPKAKGLFDHINEIRTGRNQKYFETLTDADKKSWSNYMICRFLSMQPELVEAINDLQYYQDKLSPEHFYRLCLAVVPNRRGYYPYIKNQAEKHDKDLLTLLCTHFQECERNVLEYLAILTRDELRDIISLYGYSEKDRDSMLESA
jgi:hypothetical protein